MPVTISKDLLSQIVCIACGSNLDLVEKSSLVCTQCRRIFPLTERGYFDFIIPSMDTPTDEKDVATWDIHWDNVKDLDTYLVSNEIEYFNEIAPALLRSRIVLVVGCGTGKNIKQYLMQKPKALIMTDISHSLVHAVRNWLSVCGEYPGVDVLFIRCDINNLPLIRGGTPIVYVSCGLYNILDDQSRCIRESMRFSDHIFLLFNSPENIFGRIYYALNPVRSFMKKIIPWNAGRLVFSRIVSHCAYPFLNIFISLVSKEVKNKFSRKALEFLINDWIFMSPKSIAYDRSYYEKIESREFNCKIVEKTISRIVYYRRSYMLAQGRR